MIDFIIRKVIGSKNDRELKRYQSGVDRVNALESSMIPLSDAALQAKTPELRARFAAGETLDQLLPEAFAVVREGSKRVLKMRHFDVQLIGGMVLHDGKISEMKTGEGKTLMATLPVYLNALTGRGVHVVTVNDYLARRDSQWMGEIYKFLGMTVGVIQHDLGDAERQAAYGSDIIYGTNNEFGFDFLRDNMKFDPRQFVQRELHYAIVDEVDSILIDEARTPLIISGPSEDSTDKYYKINRIIPSLKEGEDFTVEEKTKTVSLTEEGNAKVERLLGVQNLYDISNIELVHHVAQGLRAHTLFKRDVDYVVNNGEVVIVDEFTGRLMPGRRYSDGLHQALEAKEGVEIARENQTLASITFQNYFRMYQKLGGMTGTAETEAPEFTKIYNLDVVVIPTNRPMIRKDYSDMVYKTVREKFDAVADEITECHKNGQPVLVGTVSIEKSEHLSALLKKRGIRHSVLNAKYHEKEAEIVAQAGRKGGVTIATNMAGRGTDILLGGNPGFLVKKVFEAHPDLPPEGQEKVLNDLRAECEKEREEVLQAGGLHIIGTERHEARRIDNQLRGRSGRQGDPGSSRFYLSLEDDLMRIFGSERIAGLMERLGMEEGVPIEHRMVSRAIEGAQKKVEAHNFDIRKHLLEYDDVMNKQREVIYQQRRHLLSAESLQEEVLGITEDLLDGMMDTYCSEENYAENWDVQGLKETLHRQFNVTLNTEEIDLENTGRGKLRELLSEKIQAFYAAKEAEMGVPLLRHVEKVILLQSVDTQWKDHLLAMDSLKEGIGLRGYGQKDPLVEYKREGFGMFTDLMGRIQADTIERLFKIQVVREAQPPSAPVGASGPAAASADSTAPLAKPSSAPLLPPRRPQVMQMNRGEGAGVQKPAHRTEKKVGRNDPCPCGSGKKYKKCHGQ